MLVPITSADFPASLTRDAKANAETLAWFGTAYGRRDHSIDRAETPGISVILSSVIHGGPAATEAATTEAAPTEAIARPIVRQRRYAPLVVLGGVLAALLALRTMPIAPPPVLGPVHDQLPIGPANRADAERLAHDAAEDAEKLAAAPENVPIDPSPASTPDSMAAAAPIEPPSKGLSAAEAITPQRRAKSGSW